MIHLLPTKMLSSGLDDPHLEEIGLVSNASLIVQEYNAELMSRKNLVMSISEDSQAL